MDDIINIARQMRSRSMAKTLAGTCKEILGMMMNLQMFLAFHVIFR